MAISSPTIKEKGYTLRPIESRDYLDFYFIGSSFNTTRYLTWDTLKSPNEALLIINRFYLNDGDFLPNAYAILNKKSEMIGVIELHTYSGVENSCHIGFILREDYWHKGIMTLALKNVIRLAFTRFNYSKLYISHVDLNEDCKRLISRFPFKYESTNYASFLTKDTKELRDIITYSMYENDFVLED